MVPDAVTYPLSFSQQRLLAAAAGPRCTAAFGIRVRGPLDADALRRALEEVVLRHAPLRTRFRVDMGSLRQAVVAHAPGPLPITDLRGRHAPFRAAVRSIEAERGRIRPLDAAPLRMRLYRLADDDHVLAVAVHQAVADADSLAIIRREIAQRYAAHVVGRAATVDEPDRQYGDVACWQRLRLAAGGLDAGIAHWRQVLRGAAPALRRPNGTRSDDAFAPADIHCRIEIPPAVVARLRSTGRRVGVSLTSVVVAALHVLVWTGTAADDVVIGVAVPNRHRPELRTLVGPLAAVVPVRARLHPSDPILRTLVAIEAVWSAGRPYRETPVEAAIEDPDAADAAFQLQFRLSRGNPSDARFPGATVEAIALRSRAPGCAVAWELTEDAAGLRGRVLLDGRAFTVGAAQQVTAAFREVLQRLPSGLHHPLGRFVAALDAAGAGAQWAQPAAAGDGPGPGPRGRAAWFGVAPRSATEQALLSIWRDVLQDDRLGIFDSFFDQGGSSTLAARAVLEIRRRLQVAIDVSVLFEAPTVAAVAAEIERTPGGGG